MTIEGFRATKYAADTDQMNAKVKENARCTVQVVSVIQYIRDHYKNKASIHTLNQPTPLIETLRNDGQGPEIQAPVYTTNQADLPSGSGSACDEENPCSGAEVCHNGHCISGKRLNPKHINSLTKACIAGIDLNDNGIQDAKEQPSQTTSPSEFQEFLVASYFIELHHSYFSKIQYQDQSTDALVIVERPRSKSKADGGLALNCQNSRNNSDYWKRCALRDDQACSGGDGHAVKGLSQCWMEDVRFALPSLFKCVVFNNTQPQEFFYTGNYGQDKNYSIPRCSLAGGVSYQQDSKAPTAESAQFNCSADNGQRAPQGAQVGWACVRYKSYNEPKDYVAGCVNECTETRNSSGIQPCGKVL
ncbi:MAG: hypothetical protein AAGJ35_05160, partial [Myxococcota bacterium]